MKRLTALLLALLVLALPALAEPMALLDYTDDILEEIKPLYFSTEAYNKLKDTMEVADLVKFAKYSATPLESDTCLNHMTDFVNESYAHYQDMKAKEELQQRNMKMAEAEGKEANHV